MITQIFTKIETRDDLHFVIVSRNVDFSGQRAEVLVTNTTAQALVEGINHLYDNIYARFETKNSEEDCLSK